MTDRIEEKLREEISAETPDILEDLLQEFDFGENVPEKTEVIEFRPAGREKMFRILGGTAAAVFLIAAGLLLYNSGLKHGAEQEQKRYSAENQVQENAEKTEQIEQAAMVTEEKNPAAIVSLDVNPSVEITIDETEHVLSWTAVNEDAELVLNGMDLAGSDIKVAAYAVVGAMLSKGYLNEDVNSVLVSVISADGQKGRKLEQTLSKELNAFLEDSAIHAAVFGQYAGDDETVKQFSSAHHLSYGKAWLIRTLLREDPRLNEASLLNLSTQELLLLWERQPEEQPEDTRIVYGSVNTERYILPEAAVQAALQYAGLAETDVTDLSTEFGCEDGIIIYEVEFRCGGREYEIDVNAVSGEIVGSETETAGPADRPDEQAESIPETDDDPDDDDYDDPDDDEDDDHEDVYDGGDIYDDTGYEDADDFYEEDEEDTEEPEDSDDSPYEDDDDDEEDDDD